MLNEKQQEEREACLGSSDAPVVCGVSSYCSPLELFYKLHGEFPRYDATEKLHQKFGARLESVIAEIAAEELGIKIRRIPVRTHAVHTFMVAHADFEIVSNPKGPGLMEVKNRSGVAPWSSVPDDVAIQVAHQLAVTNREWALVAGLFRFGKLEKYEIQRDKELEEYLIEIEAKFMLRVQKGEPPTEAWTPDNIGILKKLYPLSTGKTIELPEEALSHVGQFLNAKVALEAHEQHKASAEGWLKERMQDAERALVPGYEITWKSTKASQRFDEERFKQTNPDLYQQYLKAIPGYRRFTVKPTKEFKA